MQPSSFGTIKKIVLTVVARRRALIAQQLDLHKEER
jgi:hypothetical protein